MRIIRNNKPLIAYSFSHLSIDFSCFFILMSIYGGSVNPGNVTFMFLLYNIIAFGIQPIIGFCLDQRPKIPAGIAGCAAVAMGVIALPYFWFSLFLCAFGNAFFHVEGGADSLRLSGGKMARSGVFVSTGALGVVFGTLYGKSAGASILLPLGLLAASALAIAFLKDGGTSENRLPNLSVSSGRSFTVVLALALMSIVIRSFVGSSLVLPWKSASSFLSLVPGIAAFAGKAFGGFTGDAAGARRTGTISLILSVPFLVFGGESPVLSFIGLALFNMTMPITLCAVASELPHNPGFAFGLTTLALLIGNIPTFFFRLPGAFAPYIMGTLAVISAACVFLSTKNKDREESHDIKPDQQNSF